MMTTITVQWCRGFAAGLWCKPKVLPEHGIESYLAGYEEGLKRRDERERARAR